MTALVRAVCSTIESIVETMEGAGAAFVAVVNVADLVAFSVVDITGFIGLIPEGKQQFTLRVSIGFAIFTNTAHLLAGFCVH